LGPGPDRKIEIEVAGLKTILEAYKLGIIKHLAGSIFICVGISLPMDIIKYI
jgi:hypothetical protein